MRITLLLCSLAFVSFGCDANDTILNIVYDPCEPVVVAAAADSSNAELESIDAALGMWRDAAGARISRLEVVDAQHLPISFEDAALAFRGIYRDELGDIVINRRLTNSRERGVTVAHECGHAFGLWHVDSSDRVSLMNPGNLTTTPTEEDVHELAALWGRCR